MDLVQKVRDLIAAVRTNDWVAAIHLALEILTIIVQGLGLRGADPAMKQAYASNAVMDHNKLADELEDCCNATLSDQGFIDSILPIMWALLKKLRELLLGF